MQPVLLAAVAAVALVFIALFFFGDKGQRGAAERLLAKEDHAELEKYRALVDDLKETAWDHREIDPALSTIMIDKIRTFERHKHQGNNELGN